ncbi:MAG TPA: hypothetical protein VFK13_10990 [Gemmatimonadaceae bacterium]|nr:hypothetical protein [Gemmatimonadaceae bacterium]
MAIRYLAAAAMIAVLGAPAGAGAQSVEQHVAAGDSAYVALDATRALEQYEAAIAASDSGSYEALWKAARSAVDLAEFEPDEAKRTALYAKGRADAARAVAVNADDPEGHFNLARALGRVALSLGKKERVKYATEVRKEALAALAIDSLHAGALHVMGMWNAEIMRLSGFSRFMARNFLGGQVFSEASWKNAQMYLEKSVQQEPERIVHHLDLGMVYVDTKQKDKAREQLEAAVNGTPSEYNDKHYQEQAREALAKLK